MGAHRLKPRLLEEGYSSWSRCCHLLKTATLKNWALDQREIESLDFELSDGGRTGYWSDGRWGPKDRLWAFKQAAGQELLSNKPDKIELEMLVRIDDGEAAILWRRLVESAPETDFPVQSLAIYAVCRPNSVDRGDQSDSGQIASQGGDFEAARETRGAGGSAQVWANDSF